VHRAFSCAKALGVEYLEDLASLYNHHTRHVLAGAVSSRPLLLVSCCACSLSSTYTSWLQNPYLTYARGRFQISESLLISAPGCIFSHCSRNGNLVVNFLVAQAAGQRASVTRIPTLHSHHQSMTLSLPFRYPTKQKLNAAMFAPPLSDNHGMRTSIEMHLSSSMLSRLELKPSAPPLFRASH